MQSMLTQTVAREQSAARVARAETRRRAAQTLHPPSRVRWRTASAVARLAIRLDPDAARIAVRS